MKKKFVWTDLILIVILLAFTFLVTSRAQTSPQFAGIGNLYRSGFADEQLSISNSSTPFTAATYNPTVAGANPITTRAEFASIECDTNSIRVWVDGTTPTSSNGILFSTSTIYTIQGFHDISNFHAIATSGTATCNVQYYRFGSNSN